MSSIVNLETKEERSVRRMFEAKSLLPPPKQDMQDYTIRIENTLYHFRSEYREGAPLWHQNLRWKFIGQSEVE